MSKQKYNIITIQPTKNIHIGQTSSYDWSTIIHGDIYSKEYSTGLFGKGWNIQQRQQNKQSFMVIDNLRIRNTLHAHIFQKDIVRATNGYLLVSDCSQIMQDVLIENTTTTYEIYLKQNVFRNGDLVWFKDIGQNYITGIKGTIKSQGESITQQGQNNITQYYKYNFKSDYGIGLMKSGGTIVRVGSSEKNRQGFLMLDASSQNAPFLQVYDGISNWTGNTSSQNFYQKSNIVARLGNLKGISSSHFGYITQSNYGLYSNNVYLQGSIVSHGGLIAGWNITTSSIYKNNIVLDSLNEKIYIGTDGKYTSSNTSFYVDKDGKFSLKDKLYFDGTNLTLSGSISASSGKIANWLINENSLYTGNGYNKSSSMYFGSSGLSLGTNFVVSSDGNLVAKNAILSGSISSSAGYIGGWSITTSSIYRVSSVFGNTNGMYFGTSGISLSDKFKVTSGGHLTSTSGSIAGWDITSNSISKNNVVLDSSGKIYIGTGSYTNSNTPFYVDKDGKFSLGDKLSFHYPIISGVTQSTGQLNISGIITSSAGVIGGWDIRQKSLSSNNISILADTSSNFSSSYSLPTPLNQLKFPYTIILPNTASSMQGYMLELGTIDLTSYSGNSFDFNLQYSYYNNTSNGKYLTAEFQIYQRSGNDQINKKTFSLQKNQTSGGKHRNIGGLYSNYISPYKFYVRLIVKRLDIQLQTNPKVNQITFQKLELVTGMYQSLTQLSQSGVFIFNDPSSYIKIGNTLDGSSLLDVKADQIVVKNLTVLQGFYTDAIIYGITQIHGTTAQTFTINTDGGGSQTALKLNLDDPSQYVKMYTDGITSIKFGNSNDTLVTMSNVVWNGENIPLSKTSGTLGVTRGGTGLTSISANKILTTLNTANTITAKNIDDLVKLGGTGLTYTTSSGYMTISPLQNLSTTGSVTFGGIKIGTNKVVTQNRSITFTGSGLSVSQSSNNLQNDISVTYSHPTYTITSTSSNSTTTFISDIGYNSYGHISNITKSNIDLSHNHNVKVGSTTNSIGVGQTLEFVSSGRASVSLSNKKLTIGATISNITISNGLQSTFTNNIYNGSSAGTISHATYTTSSSGTGQFISNITVDNGHISTITREDFDNSHNHKINNISFGIDQNITVSTASNSILTVTNNTTNKTILFDITPKILSFGTGISASANSYNSKTAVTINHKTLDTGSYTSSHSSSSYVLNKIGRDSYGHIISNEYINIYTLFNNTNPITYNNTNGTFGLSYNSTNLKLTSNALNTIQNISTTSSPTFKQLNLNLDTNNKSNLKMTNTGLILDTSFETKDFIQLISSNNNFKTGIQIDNNGCVYFYLLI